MNNHYLFTTDPDESSETCVNFEKAQNQIRLQNSGVAEIKSSVGGDTVILPEKSLTSCDGGGVGDIISAYSPSERYSVLTTDEIKMDDPGLILETLTTKNSDKIIIGHLNINFIENKFSLLVSLVKDKLDIFMVSETKIDDSFPENQFIIEGYSKPYRRDRNSHGGGLLIYVRDVIPCKKMKLKNIPDDIECIFIEIKLRNQTWILMGGYNPEKGSITYFLTHVSREFDKVLGNYDHMLLLGDFNCSVEERNLKDFCEMYDLENLIREPTCFKDASNPSSIDVMLTNRKNSFKNSTTIETGLSDHHKMTVTVLKTYFKKKEPIQIDYRSYKYFTESEFRIDLQENLLKHNKETMDYDDFKSIFIHVLDRHAPKKKKVVRGNNAPFMNKILSKAFMHRSKLKNRYNKNPNELNKNLYKNFCVKLLRKEKGSTTATWT